MLRCALTAAQRAATPIPCSPFPIPSKRSTSLVVVYSAGALQGFAFVLVPALGAVLQAAPYRLSAEAYGALFLPESLGAILSALLAGPFDRRAGAHGVLRLGLACNVGAAALLAASALGAGTPAAYAMLLAETTLLGAGFGFTLSVTNGMTAALFPQHDVAAVTVLNAVIGGATAASPLILQWLQPVAAWWWWPATLALGFAVVLLLSLLLPPAPAAPRAAEPGGGLTRLLALFAAAALLYAVVEGTFGSWITRYAAGHHFPAHAGALALAAFWGAMTAFRVLLGLVPERVVAPRRLYLAAPPAIAIAFVAVATVTSPAGLVVAFAGAGAACSIYYPFTMSFALEAFPDARTRAAGVLVAALMAGEGLGSWLLGPLQRWLDLGLIYLAFALWAVPLFLLARRLGGARAGGRRAASRATR